MITGMQPWAEEALKAIGIAMGTLLTAWGVRRRIGHDKVAISHDSLTVQKNDGEAAWMADNKRERDECLRREREIYALHQQDAQKIAGLELKNTLMVEKFERLEREMVKLKRLLLLARPDLAPLLDSDFGDLPDMRHPTTKRSDT